MTDIEIKLNFHDRWSCGKCGYTVFKRRGKKGGAKGGARASGRRRSPRKRMKST